MSISLIVAVAENGVIGKTGDTLPWRLPADLAHFKKITMSHPIIMGRKTYQTIGRPLPGRHNIIISRDLNFQAEGCSTATSLNGAIEIARASHSSEIFIIGGGTVYKEALPLASIVYLTLVHAEPDGDVYFHYRPQDWQQTAREDHPADDKNQYAYSFIHLRRK